MFHYDPSRIDSKRFLSNFNIKKKYYILDYGCGVGVWNNNLLSKKFIKKIFLYDPDQGCLKICKHKYLNQKKIFYISNKKELKKILKYKKLNFILLNSVIQYISPRKIMTLLINFKNNFKNKKFKIIIADVPKFNRIIEFILLFFFDFIRFYHALKLILKFKNYKRNTFYYKNLNIEYLKKNFNLSKIENINFYMYRDAYVLKNK